MTVNRHPATQKSWQAVLLVCLFLLGQISVALHSHATPASEKVTQAGAAVQAESGQDGLAGNDGDEHCHLCGQLHLFANTLHSYNFASENQPQAQPCTPHGQRELADRAYLARAPPRFSCS